jgi:methyl-accepting chemotaxis protein
MSGLAQVYRRSWFARIVTTFAAMFTALVGLVLVGVWLATTNLIAESARQELEADLASFAEVYAQRLLPGLREAVERRAAEIGDARIVLLVGRQGETLAGNRDRIPADLLHAETTPRRFGSYLGVSKPLLGGFTLALAHDRTRDDALLRRLALALGGLSLIAVVFSLAGGFVIGQTALTRVEALNATLAKVAAGDLSTRAPGAGGADEFSTLAGGLNATLERMGALVAALKAVAERIGA